jgi:hypothetical protein
MFEESWQLILSSISNFKFEISNAFYRRLPAEDLFRNLKDRMLLGVHLLNVAPLNDPLSTFGAFHCEHQPGMPSGIHWQPAGSNPAPRKRRILDTLLVPC